MEIQRQSALHACHIAAHAQLSNFSGWQLPAVYTEASAELAQARAAVGISDASYLSKLDIRGTAGEFAFSLPAKRWNLTRSHSLITSPEPIRVTSSPSVTDVTSVFGAILLAGPKSRDILQKLSTLNVRESAMPDGAARQTRLAHVNATVLRIDSEGLPGFLLLITRDVTEHVWHTLLHAGEAHSAQPFGAIAQKQWMGFRNDHA
jgi:glycine cleavage system aminomethyltransferase T